MNKICVNKGEIWIRACINTRSNTRLTSCSAKGSREMVAALQAGVIKRSLNCQIETVHCMSKCHLGPTMKVLPNAGYIMGVKLRDVPQVLDLLEQNGIERLIALFPLLGQDA